MSTGKSNTKLLYLTFLFLGVTMGCTEESEPLPFLGQKQIEEKIVNGEEVTDTIPYTIPAFKMVNQEGDTLTEETVEGSIYVADFFFTSCPTICPKMKQQLLRVYEKYESEPKVKILSHSIDPRHDSVSVLKEYAEKLGVSAPKWHFMTGERDSIYTLARAYMIPAEEDPEAPGGYAHSGAFLLIDENRHVRGVYDGTDPESVDKLLRDIKTLLRHG